MNAASSEDSTTAAVAAAAASHEKAGMLDRVAHDTVPERHGSTPSNTPSNTPSWTATAKDTREEGFERQSRDDEQGRRADDGT